MGFCCKPYLPRVNYGRPLSQKIWAALPFIEGSGDYTNECINNIPSSLITGASWGTTPWGHGIYTDGATGWVNSVLPKNSDLGSNFTVVVCFRSERDNVNDYVFIIGDADGTHRHVIYKPGALILRFYNQMGGLGSQVDGAITQNEWYQAILTMDSSAAYAYINGKYVGTFTPRANTSATMQNIGVGRNYLAGKDATCFQGTFAYAYVLNRKISHNEAALFYMDPFSPFRWPNGNLPILEGGYVPPSASSATFASKRWWPRRKKYSTPTIPI